MHFAIDLQVRRCGAVSFCSRVEPSLVCQEITVQRDGACELGLRAAIEASGIDGEPIRRARRTPGESEPAVDGSLLWRSAGGLSTCGMAMVTELLGAGAIQPVRPPLAGGAWSASTGCGPRLGGAFACGRSSA